MVVDTFKDATEPIADLTGTAATNTVELFADGSDDPSEPTGPGGGVDLNTGFPDTSDEQNQPSADNSSSDNSFANRIDDFISAADRLGEGRAQQPTRRPRQSQSPPVETIILGVGVAALLVVFARRK